jgi:hypothetical protein
MTEESKAVRKVIFRNGQSPGDGVMLVHAMLSLHMTYPGKFLTDIRCPYGQLFEGAPYITSLDENDKSVEIYELGYETIHKSNQFPYHFVTGFLYDMMAALKVHIDPAPWHGFIHIRDEEKWWFSGVRQIVGADIPYWVVNAGYKIDYTAKQWAFDYYQRVIDMNKDVTFVQVGAKHPHHVHADLKGDNVINMIGQTDLRQMIRLVYNSFGVLTPCSMAMILGYAVPAHPRFNRKSRACVVVSGGREPNHWQQGPNQQFLHTCGQLACCDMGGCWKSRVVKLNDGDRKDDELCHMPVQVGEQWVAKCMAMITPEEVSMHIRRYMDNLEFEVEKGQA